MTRERHEPNQRHTKPPVGARLSVWLLWPIATVMLGGVPFLLASALSSGRTRVIGNFWEPIYALGQWAEPAFASGFDALAVFTTLLVAIAAITGFSGDWSALPVRARSHFSALVVLAVALLVSLATLTPAVIATAPGTSSRAALLWLAAWGVMLVTLAIAEVLPFRSQVVLARLRALRAEQRVKEVGYDLPPHDASLPAWPIAALATLFGVPVVAWVLFSTCVAVISGFPLPNGGLFVALGYGGFISLVGWMLRSNASASSASRMGALLVIATGIGITITFAITIAAVSAAVAWGLAVVACASAVLLLPVSVTRSVPLLRIVQRWRTFQSLGSLRARSRDMAATWRATRAGARATRTPRWKEALRALLS